MARPWSVLFAPVRLWERSLPFRVVLTTLLASGVILSLAGWFLLAQSGRGIIDAKTQSSLAEATAVMSTMRAQLAANDPRNTTPNELVRRLALEAAGRGQVGSQYYVLVETPIASIGSAGMAASSVSDDIRQAIGGADGLYSQPTLISYTDGRPAEPGLVVASQLSAPGSDDYPVFFIFPTAAEAKTLEVVQQASIAAGSLLLAGLLVLVYLVTAQVLRPVRAARVAAERLAAGHLDDRMRVVGTADLSALAMSMNHMAGELDKKITQLQDLSAVQQRFVSDVSHELRTPMTTIRMASEVIHQRKDSFDAPTRRSAELLSAEVDRFEELLTELLEISRFDAGAAQLNLDEVDLAQLAADEVEAVRPLAESSGSVVAVQASPPVLCEADGRRIRRILRNLLVNAVEHGEGKPVDVVVAADDDAVAVAVRDHGIGLSAHDAEHVFDRFWRADPARGRRVGGTGLGLSIALEDARLHGGWLDAWGEPGQGAQFRLTLPRRARAVLSHSPIDEGMP
ncbi:MAG: HAMP domain-containing histidine kinase [Propionibacteriaceae bacterium]|jgi:two-component system sensor histidine kinase MtrB|nr:HAMP domain-containing histidine kinase [Propionibacteriaceae bacterium]